MRASKISVGDRAEHNKESARKAKTCTCENKRNIHQFTRDSSAGRGKRLQNIVLRAAERQQCFIAGRAEHNKERARKAKILHL